MSPAEHCPVMVSSIASSPAVDLSALAAPPIIDQPDFEARYAAKLARLISLIPDFNALVESDPAIKLIQSDSYDEMVQVQAFADAAKVEPVAGLRVAKEFVIAMGPSQTGQIIAHPRRRLAHGLIFFDPKRAVAFR